MSRRCKATRFSDVERLTERVLSEAPKAGEYFYDYKLSEAKQEETLLKEEEFHKKYKINFSDLPISAGTLKGLQNRSFKKMTEVQRCSIPHALAGRDIMAASRTGSGKTLSYLVPLVQKLYRQRFIPLDGVGAIVLVPVRELAMQVFEVLNSFSLQVELNVALIIGGKDLAYEQTHIATMNILVCTPGRLLQHIQETYGFQLNNLQMLVLDEADVMIQMGFKDTLTAILSSLPKCQTLFFSATLNHHIHALAALSLNDPQRIFLQRMNSSSVQIKYDNYETPAKLMQYYMLVQAESKVSTLYSFIKSHPKQKILVFVSTCKQVRFLYECLRKFRLGCPLYELQGHQKQKKRMAIYFTFVQKRYGILVCTNIASRGLDFPRIDWVLQFDLPQNLDTYVHRVGRTARFKAEGKALSFVASSEEPFIHQLQAKSIEVHKITQNPQRYFDITSSVQSICSEHHEVKYLAQRAVISYLKFLHKAQNKQIFHLKAINLQALANSYGLINAPIVTLKLKQEAQLHVDTCKITKIQKLRLKAKLKKKQTNIDSTFLTVKQIIKEDPNSAPILSASKRQLKKIKPQGPFEGKNKYFIDDDLNKITVQQMQLKTRLEQNKEQIDYDPMSDIQMRFETHQSRDHIVEKERRKQKRRKFANKNLHKGEIQTKMAFLNDSDEQLQ